MHQGHKRTQEALAICCIEQSSSLSQSCAAQLMWYSTLSTQSRLLSILHSSVHWACFTLNYPIGRLGPAPANGHLLASFRRSVDTKILLFAKSKNAIQASHIWAPLLPLPRKPLFLSVSLRPSQLLKTRSRSLLASPSRWTCRERAHLKNIIS